MRSYISIAAFFATTILSPSIAEAESAIDRSKRDGIAMVEPDDPDMAVAFRKARETLPAFLKLARAPRLTMRGFSVKVGVSNDDDTEYFWISPFKQQGDRYAGPINNTPQLVKTVKLGQVIDFAESEIVDWLYLDGNRMIGNFTACALLKHEPPEEAQAFMKLYRLRCDP